MKLGIKCDDTTYKKIMSKYKDKGITFYDYPDLYLVERNQANDEMPYIVFDKDQLDKLYVLIDELSSKVQTDKIIAYEEERFHVILIKDVIYFEAKDTYVYVRTNERTLRVKEKLYEIENMLSNDCFIRINRSTIININEVATIAPWFNRRLLLTFNHSKDTLEVSKNYVNDFKRFLGMR